MHTVWGGRSKILMTFLIVYPKVAYQEETVRGPVMHHRNAEGWGGRFSSSTSCTWSSPCAPRPSPGGVSAEVQTPVLTIRA